MKAGDIVRGTVVMYDSLSAPEAKPALVTGVTRLGGMVQLQTSKGRITATDELEIRTAEEAVEELQKKAEEIRAEAARLHQAKPSA